MMMMMMMQRHVVVKLMVLNQRLKTTTKLIFLARRRPLPFHASTNSDVKLRVEIFWHNLVLGCALELGHSSESVRYYSEFGSIGRRFFLQPVV